MTQRAEARDRALDEAYEREQSPVPWLNPMNVVAGDDSYAVVPPASAPKPVSAICPCGDCERARWEQTSREGYQRYNARRIGVPVVKKGVIEFDCEMSYEMSDVHVGDVYPPAYVTEAAAIERVVDAFTGPA